jgi:hypothetical protein
MVRSFTAAAPVWKGMAVPVLAWRGHVLGAFAELSRSLALSRPRLYLLVAAVLALAGYAWLLLFPWLVFRSGQGLYAAIAGSHGIAWTALLFWTLAGAGAMLVCYRLYRLRFALPAGTALDRAKHPALFELVADLSRQYDGSRIDRIVLTGDFAIDIVRTPRFALPLGATHTLLIGRPLLQCLSEIQFRCALARRLGQFSMRYNLLENWLYRLRDVWPQYCRRVRRDIGYQPVAWFFCVYAPLYRAVTAPAAELDELAADKYAMELFSDEEVLDTITTLMVCNHYLREKYWPVVRKYAARNRRLRERLHSGMATVLHAGLQDEAANTWLAKTLAAVERCGDPVPSLARRIDNIGFSATRMSPLAAQTAAAAYLGGQASG